MKNNKITIQSTISASPKKVWAYYTSPEHITQWNFATPDWHCPKAENDLKVGGKYLATMAAKDGSFSFDFEAIYEAIKPGESFTYVMTDGRTVDINFDDLGDQTKVSVAFDPESQNDAEMQRAGWQAILNNFKKYTEK